MRLTEMILAVPYSQGKKGIKKLLLCSIRAEKLFPCRFFGSTST